MNPPRRFMSADELAQWLPFTENTIRKWTSMGRIPSFRKGRRRLYDWLQITAWLEAGEVENG